ncbi:MAG: DNA-3-methyladenine glycosylase [Candidatus Hydrogenedentota bacterium]|nr:MAG: DNA-3-methyladenine glycosylase [Candidatus Hydrogenedentota bacterium]
MGEVLDRSFFEQDVLTVAEKLIGAIFYYETYLDFFVAEILETEAYHEKDDPACHAYRGKTKRNEVMFGPPGHLYVYFTYGMHYCMNIVCEPEGVAAAVLLRSMRPISGIESMQKNRGEKMKLKDLMRGPARLTQAMGITTGQNGMPLDRNRKKPRAWIELPTLHSHAVQKATRIGISSGQELKWRFLAKDNPWVSRKG